MASLFKKMESVRDPKTGQKVRRKSKKWWGKYRDSSQVVRRVPLATDKAAAQAMLNELVKKAERKAAGLSTEFDEHLKRPITEHIKEFAQFLRDKGSSKDHVERTERKVRCILADAKAGKITEISASRVQGYLGKLRETGYSITTVNHYLRAIKMFTRWLVMDRRTNEDRLLHLSMENPDSDRRRLRRPLSPEEFEWLLRATEDGPAEQEMGGPDRVMLYLIGCYTGFRRNEIFSVCPASFDFDSEPAKLTVQAGYSKRRREDVIPLRADLAIRIRNWIASKSLSCTQDPLFAVRTDRTAEMLRMDLERARAAWIKEAADDKEKEAREKSQFLRHQDTSGRVVDFHALRMTFITNLSLSGVSPKSAQQLARHSTINLTMNTYTMISVNDQAVAVEKLPAIPMLVNGAVKQGEGANGQRCQQKMVPPVVPSGAQNGVLRLASHEARTASNCTEDEDGDDRGDPPENAKSPEENGASRVDPHSSASVCINGRGGDRTRTGITPHGILSPVRLPIPPLGRRGPVARETTGYRLQHGAATLAIFDNTVRRLERFIASRGWRRFVR
jgi:integrase/recombinase XerD